MKLLLCKNCQDIIRLTHTKKTCSCGKTSGRYIDNMLAIYCGDDAIPIGISNPSIKNAVINQPEDGLGYEFKSFVIPKNSRNFKKVKKI